jgi:ABC-2 type transport system ATP-binding protein
MLTLHSIQKKYNNHHILDHIGLSLNPGEIISILGPNGAGKTTLYKIITGIIPQDSGSIFWNQTSLSPFQLRQKIGYCTQQGIDWTYLRVEEQFYYLASFYGMTGTTRKEKIEYLLNELDLQPHRSKFFTQLSGGLQKRFNIAMSILHNPSILILDEPTNGLDMHSKIQVRNLIRRLASQLRMAILLTSHDLPEIGLLADRILFLDAGKLLEVFTSQNNTRCQNLEELYMNHYSIEESQ